MKTRTCIECNASFIPDDDEMFCVECIKKSPKIAVRHNGIKIKKVKGGNKKRENGK